MTQPDKSALVDTAELCKELAAMAGFIDDKRTREKIYKTIRQLQLLDKLADATKEKREPKTLWGMISAIYEGLDEQDCAYVDREWMRMRGLKPQTTGSKDGTSTSK